MVNLLLHTSSSRSSSITPPSSTKSMSISRSITSSAGAGLDPTARAMLCKSVAEKEGTYGVVEETLELVKNNARAGNVGRSRWLLQRGSDCGQRGTAEDRVRFRGTSKQVNEDRNFSCCRSSVRGLSSVMQARATTIVLLQARTSKTW